MERNIIEDISGWQDDLKAMETDGRMAARRSLKYGVNERGVLTHPPMKIAYSELKAFIDTLLFHREFRPALEAIMINEFVNPPEGWPEEPDGREVPPTDPRTLPNASYELLRDFVRWYMVVRDLPAHARHPLNEVGAVPGLMIQNDVESAFDEAAEQLIAKRLSATDCIDFAQ